MNIPKRKEKWLLRWKPSERAQETGWLVVRILIGGLFFYSGVSKLMQPIEYFEIAVEQYSLVPDSLIHPVALTIPWIELIFSIYLLLGYRLPLAAGMLGMLTFSFQCMLAQAILRHLPMDECGCFGGGAIHLTLFQSFTLDTFLLLALIKLTGGTRYLNLDRFLASG